MNECNGYDGSDMKTIKVWMHLRLGVLKFSIRYKGRKTVRANNQSLELEHKLKMARFCLVIFLAIYASGLVASEPQSEEGLGALSKADHRAIDAPSYPGWKAIISYVPIKVTVISFVSTGYYPVMHSCNFKITCCFA